MKVIVVHARNPVISGVVVSVHANRQSADDEAAKLMALIRDDWLMLRGSEEHFYGEKRPNIPEPSPSNYNEVLVEMTRWDIEHGIPVGGSYGYSLKVEERDVIGLPS